MVDDLVPHKGQQAVLNSSYQFNVVATGRYFGKSYLCNLLAHQYKDEGKKIYWINGIEKEMKSYLDSLGGLPQNPFYTKFQNDGYIRIINGGNLSKLIGARPDILIIDDAAFLKEDLWQIIYPFLVENEPHWKMRAFLISTPNGMYNNNEKLISKKYFWHYFQLGFDPFMKNWMSFRFPSDMNPAFSEQMKATKKEFNERRAAEQFEGAFLDNLDNTDEEPKKKKLPYPFWFK